MDIRKLQRAIVDGLEDVKAANILVFNTEHLSPLFERVIIASGTSNRQTKSLAASVRDAVKASGFPVLRTEGEGNGEWIIVDCGAAVAHIMQPAIRDYYHLEEIWGEKPVKMKLETRTTRLVKASEEDQDEPAPSRRAARAAAHDALADDEAAAKPTRSNVRGTATKKAGTRARPLGSPTLRTPPKKAVVEKVSVPGTAVGRAAVAAAAGSAGRKTAAGKTAAPAKSPARKTAAGKTAAGKGSVTRTVGTKGSAPTTEVTRTRTIVINAPGRATAETSAGRAATSRPGAARKTAFKTASKTAYKTASTRAAPAARKTAPRGAPAKTAAVKSAARPAAPRKTTTRK